MHKSLKTCTLHGEGGGKLGKVGTCGRRYVSGAAAAAEVEVAPIMGNS